MLLVAIGNDLDANLNRVPRVNRRDLILAGLHHGHSAFCHRVAGEKDDKFALERGVLDLHDTVKRDQVILLQLGN